MTQTPNESPAALEPEPAAFLGRQPILDRNQQLIGYELLYRADAQATEALFTDGEFASLVVIASLLQDIGPEQVLGGKLGFVNVGPESIGDDSPIMLLEPKRTVLEFEVRGSDVDRLTVYSNGRLVRTLRVGHARGSGPRSVRINGNAYESLTVVAHDAFGARSYAKNYAFYPRVQVFRQGSNGKYEIGFLPGSARNSLDRFFFIGGSGKVQNQDPLIATF
jgi:EAL and modified HD-GYP domain-containing signal transduction protein